MDTYFWNTLSQKLQHCGHKNSKTAVMPTTDIQKMCILDCDFKFGADKKLSTWNILQFS